ncbi:GNAT family N-acetyltransferase [Actinacidiphila oryziradicis]|uniref:GNAT family N-acetyltransferase n=1 Tax=Actinacidiphila oryziradicis TaxID=2571141 RepID=UPI0023F21C37|nr:GNAT family N-acetyltransferase [Actinacidiphila oryziradicis]MCW2873040.1 GCN5-related N-acetyltransferase [Actinacidiphila oryziradicis]
MTDLVIRPLTAGESHLFTSLPDPGLVGRAAFGQTYAAIDEGGGYRPEWTWVALRDDAVVARAAWWAGPDDDKPLALDWFDFIDGDAAVQLLRTAPLHAEYDLLLPPGWRDTPDVRGAAQARIDAAIAAGMNPLVERYRYTWTPECGLPEQPGRLEFHPEPDDAVILDVLRRIGQGSLDAHTRDAVGKHGTDRAAQEELDILNWFPSPREWWRLARTPEGEPVGIQVPARNFNGPCIGFIGVLPEQRGHAYAYDLLVECTHDLVGQGAQGIAAATDQGNFPMAAHFAKAGFPITQERINLI